jgi:hypothetical protein
MAKKSTLLEGERLIPIFGDVMHISIYLYNCRFLLLFDFYYYLGYARRART